MSLVERFIILCPYLGESTIRDSTVVVLCMYLYTYLAQVCYVRP